MQDKGLSHGTVWVLYCSSVIFIGIISIFVYLFFELLTFFQGGGRNVAAFISKILSTVASSKVNYSSSLQP